MFLKQEKITIRDSSILISELSALQRLEYFEYLASLETNLPGDTSEIQNQAWQMKLNINVNAWLISRSLWHETPDRDVNDLHQEILRSWPTEAINIAVEKILNLSDMIPDAPDENTVETEDADSVEQEKPLAK